MTPALAGHIAWIAVGLLFLWVMFKPRRHKHTWTLVPFDGRVNSRIIILRCEGCNQARRIDL